MTREFRVTFIHEDEWWVGWSDDVRTAARTSLDKHDSG